MTDRVDCAVIGGGVAGAIAALELRARGHRVTIVSASDGASAHCAGPWDTRASLEGASHLAGAAPWATEVLERVRALCPELFVTRDDGALPRVVSELGRTKPTAAHDPAILDLASAPAGRIAVASLAGHPSWDGRHIARALDVEAIARGEARRFASVEIDFLRRGRDRVLHPHELAAELDVDGADPRRGMDARYVMSEAIRAGLGGLSFDAVLVPPILGLRCDDVRSELEAAVGLPIGEAVGLLPGVAGARLMRRLGVALARSGVETVDDRVTAIEGGRIVRERGETPARAFLVATGKHLGGGIALREGRTVEALLGASVEQPSPDGATNAGIALAPDGRVRGLPKASVGEPIFACGAVLASCSGVSGLVDVARSALEASRAIDAALRALG